MKELVGKHITGISLDSASQSYMTFHTLEGDVHYRVTGDCCSRSYFSEIIGFKNIDEKLSVLAVEDIDLGAGDPKPEEDVISVYGIRIRLKENEYETASILVIFRNDSNGYYGGSCDVVGSIPESSEDEVIKMEKVTKDFSI